jgi:predicted transcriptional regulator
MLSIRPKWVEKIASGEKTIEVRKTRPKLDTPFKCYIYCTLQGCNEFFRVDLGGDVAKWNRGKWADRKGNVIGEFTCDRIYKIDKDSTDFLFKAGGLSVYKQAAEEKCGLCVAMTDDELHGYLGHYQGYGWHISDLLIYDQPRELSEFQRATDPCVFCMERIARECTDCKKWGGDIKRPPQSWCYVEAME